MSRAGSLLAVFPVLIVVDRRSDHVWECLFNDLKSDLPSAQNETGFDARLHIAQTRDKIGGALKELRSAVDDPRLSEMEMAEFALIRKALDSIETAQTLRDWKKAFAEFEKAANQFSEILSCWLEDAFGEWGTLFLEFICEKVSPSDLSAFCQDIAGDTWKVANGSLPTLDESTFAIQLGERMPCWLGNTRAYYFLKVLLETPNCYMSFTEIATKMGGDAEDADSLKAVKCRLCLRLKQRGYADLADAILAQAEHYGFFSN